MRKPLSALQNFCSRTVRRSPTDIHWLALLDRKTYEPILPNPISNFLRLNSARKGEMSAVPAQA